MTSTDTTIRICIPRPPDIANGRQHWAAAVSDKKALWQQLQVRSQVRHGFPLKPAAPMARATIRVVWRYMNRAQRPDPDNVTRRLKPVLDWLVLNDWLAGDTADHVTILPIEYTQGHVGMPPLTSVELYLTPAAA